MRKWIAMFAALTALTATLTGCADVEPKDSSMSSSLSSGSSMPQEEKETDLAQVSGYTNEELGVAFELPEMLDGHTKILEEKKEAYGETYDAISVYYLRNPEDSSLDVHVLTIEVMGKDIWTQMQQEGGPLGTVLADSEDDRTAVVYTLQSNPFAETDEEYALFEQLPKEQKIVFDSFRFLS